MYRNVELPELRRDPLDRRCAWAGSALELHFGRAWPRRPKRLRRRWSGSWTPAQASSWRSAGC